MNLLLKKQEGFTLIELLVVISIIGLLSSIVLVSLNSARSSTRTSQRTQALIQVRNALELYYSKHGKYPSTNAMLYASDSDTNGNVGATPSPGGIWIPGLVTDGDISSLPHDPRPNVAITPDCDPTNYNWGAGESAFYVYGSKDGSGYELASICGSENPISTKSSFFESYLLTSYVFTDLHTLKMCVGTADCNGGNQGDNISNIGGLFVF